MSKNCDLYLYTQIKTAKILAYAQSLETEERLIPQNIPFMNF